MVRLLALGALVGLAAAAPVVDKRVDENDASRFTYYDMPTLLAGPCDLANGPDGLVYGEDILTNNLFTIDPESGKVTEYPIPYNGPALPITNLPGANTTQNRGAFACAIRPGGDGNMYAATGIRNQFVRFEVKTKKITVFTPPQYDPIGNLEPFNDLWSVKDGMYFSQTTAGVITYFDYATEQFTNYPVPSGLLAGPLGMYVASDGYLYFTEFLAQKLGRFDTVTKQFEEYPIDDVAGFGPAVIRAESDGKVWFTALVGGSIGSLDMKTHEIKVYPNTYPLSLPSEDTVDCDGRVWFSTISQNSINYIVPSTGKITNIVQPGTLLLAPVSLPFGFEVAVNYRPNWGSKGDIWFTDALYNRVGRYRL